MATVSGGEGYVGGSSVPVEWSRRAVVRGAIALAGVSAVGSRGWTAPAQWYIGIITDEPYDIRIVDKMRIPAAFHRQVVPFQGPEPPGTLVVVRGDRFLYSVEPGGRALRFGISVGRQGMEWQGEAVVGRKAR
jgi:lipoprotein-anchoring transpeptidase ErfK/SrfK